MKSKEKAHFNRVAGIFDIKFNLYLKPAGILRKQRRIELFEQYCNLKPGLKTLEIGCGTGEFTRDLLKYELNLFATDLSFSMLKKAIGKIGKTKNLIFFLSDIEQLPIRSDTFDAVIGNSILHHVKIEVALREIFRALKRGGRFAFSEPNMLNPQIFLHKRIRFIKELVGDSPDETALSRWNLKKTLERAGFRNIIIKPFDFLHPCTPEPFIKIIKLLGLFLEKTPVKEIGGSLLITGEK